ncbi:MAG: hypothetical protein OXT67_13195 [Zetaproteobacteria bacterium]|nr:hypothetical protein [Zetaproteobacteria bacterium]
MHKTWIAISFLGLLVSSYDANAKKVGARKSSYVKTLAKSAYQAYRSNNQNGHLSPQQLQSLAGQVTHVHEFKEQSPDRYQEVVYHPYLANDATEFTACLEAREYLVYIDGSWSMRGPDIRQGGTLWQSAQNLTQAIIDSAISLDRDGMVEVAVWSGSYMYKQLLADTSFPFAATYHNRNYLTAFFQQNLPANNTRITPLGPALEELYHRKIYQMLQNREPVSIIVATDGNPSDKPGQPGSGQQEVIRIISRMVAENQLAAPGNESLLAISFVQLGDDPGAENFLRYLDNNLRQYTGGVDVVDTKKDDWVYQHGPIALFAEGIHG